MNVPVYLVNSYHTSNNLFVASVLFLFKALMSKTKTFYACTECGAQFPKWMGQCTDCQAWNSLIAEVISHEKINPRLAGFSSESTGEVTLLKEVQINEEFRHATGLSEFDRVLGGGLINGSVTLIGGDPGIGKSTLLLQTLANLNKHIKTLYITGEESLQQVSLRAQRLKLQAQELALLTETNVDRILQILAKNKPQVVVIDSIQTMFCNQLQSAPGGIGQVRESAQLLVRFAKQHQIALFLIGHVTKEGMIAGPRVLEHMVDCVLYFEGQTDSRYRIIRAVKNRFGAANELGVFAMTETGLKEVNNPSAIFLSRENEQASGSVVMATWEGTRPLLVEVQALVDQSHIANPRRVTVGIEHNRLAMLLAVLHRHGGVATYDQDVFANIVGGVKINETAIDLALIMAIVSSLRDKPLPRNLIIFGEVGLTGEIRPVPCGQERLYEAHKLGFTQAIIPHANTPKKNIAQFEVIGVTSLQQALQFR